MMNFRVVVYFAMLIVALSAKAAPADMDAFAMDPAMADAAVSPDGKHIATLQRFEKDGDVHLLIYNADDLAEKPVTLGADKMQIRDFFWANSKRIVVIFSQDVDILEKMGANTRIATRIASIDVKGEKWVPLPRRKMDRRSEFSKFVENLQGASFISLLPEDPNHILLKYDDDQNGVADIFKVNVNNGNDSHVIKDSSDISIDGVDFDGEVRLATTFDSKRNAIVALGRIKGEKEWLEIGSTEAREKNVSLIFNALGFYNKQDPNELLVISNHDADTAGVFSFDLKTQKFKELLFRHPQYDALGVVSRPDTNGFPVLLGFSYSGKGVERYLIDPAEEALQKGIDAVLPGTSNRIVSRTKDDSVMIVRANGPRTPNTWYLLKNGGIQLLGKSMPFLEPEMLADVQWKRYKARDGMEIPMLVTVPNGKPPFPTVVLPHGGPVARDFWGFDLWAQILANNGYLVLQPQFRISEGFGRKHLEAGFARWGYEMQDDLEDAAKFAADQGLADLDNLAIFGWSYGGYAAFVGSFRDPNPYKCAIAGAGVADIPFFRARLADFGDFTELTYRRTVDGINPLDHVDSVDIPILVIHGDVDERVPIAESDKFVAKLKQLNKKHKYVVLEGANHFYGTIYYRHWMEMFPAMLDWLEQDCSMKAKH